MTSAAFRRWGRGFTLVELLVGLLAAGMVAAGLAAVLTSASRSTATVTRLVGLRQGLRQGLLAIGEDLRRAGRGGLDSGALPTGLALAVVNDLPPGNRIGGPGSARAAPGTDVLVVRGILTGDLFRIAAGGWSAEGLLVRALTPEGRLQELEPLAVLVGSGRPEILWLSGPPGAGVGAAYDLVGGAARRRSGSGFEQVLLELRAPAAGGPLPRPATHLGVFEERRYFIRAPSADGQQPRLARSRLLPGSGRRHPSDPAGGRDLVDGIEDLQVALGIDRDGDGRAREAVDPAARAGDEWLFNHPGDAADPELWRGRLRAVRVTLVARSDTPEPSHRAAAIGRLEDHVYGESDPPRSPEEARRRRFRRLRRTLLVAPRNL